MSDDEEEYQESKDADVFYALDEYPTHIPQTRRQGILATSTVQKRTSNVSFADQIESTDEASLSRSRFERRTTNLLTDESDPSVGSKRRQTRASIGRTLSADRRNSRSGKTSRTSMKALPISPKSPSSSKLNSMLKTILPWSSQDGSKKKSAEGNTLDQDTALGMAFGGASNQWDNMAAAAAVVSGATTGSDFRAQRRYSVGDLVLVVGHVATQTNDEEAMDDYGYSDLSRRKNLIYNPVNKHGFPPGKGATEEERRPPYVYVLATVNKVHFGEDARYYTVTREDNQLEQRADTEFMEPVTTERAEKAAMEAAHQTQPTLKSFRSSKGRSYQIEKSLGQRSEESEVWKYCCLCAHCLDCTWMMLKSAVTFCFNRVLTRLSSAAVWSYHFAKNQATLILNGLKPYEVKLRLTYVNVLVLCSFIFMFSDTFRLAFFPPSYDTASVYIAFVVWILLVLELIFEVFIRPTGYNALIHSEKAYAPSTARFINRFHLTMEFIALILYIPEISCIFSKVYSCSDASPLGLLNATLMTALAQSSSAFFGPNSFLFTASTRKIVFVGNCLFAILRLRIFGVVRHWKRMWINRSLSPQTKSRVFWKEFFLPPGRVVESEDAEKNSQSNGKAMKKTKKYREDDGMQDEDDSVDLESDAAKANAPKPPSKEEDLRLRNAATIGTALMVINSHRTMLLLVSIVAILPIISTIRVDGGANVAASEMTTLLQGNNLVAPSTSLYDCEYLGNATAAWLQAMAFNLQNDRFGKNERKLYLLWAEILPVRCDFQGADGVVTVQACDYNSSLLKSYSDLTQPLCGVWTTAPASFARTLNIREGEILSNTVNITYQGQQFIVKTTFDESYAVKKVNTAQFLLQLFLLLIVLIGLSVLRFDAHRLVLNPLRRMLKIVLRYAENPLASAPKRAKGADNKDTDNQSDRNLQNLQNEDSESEEEDSDHEEDELGHYETEQLISAITKITDLLRKCWGVAGADIISSNLARTEGGKTAVFNPCVPGRLVYALFGFVGICDFSQHLRALDQDVMILINDVARVVHGEVYRWGFGDTGQCNKNLGAVFLMVFRIGDSKEVEKKKMKATEVIFSSKRKENSASLRRRLQRGKVGSQSFDSNKSNKAVIRRKKIVQRRRKMSELMSDNLQLASLPGISTFADRALIGFLKSYAAIHRDRKMQSWKNDFRLGAGVGAFSVDMMFGMDAGWAVEGAVGSEYKIDATYLSPHVNMASRMMSASKQYGVKLLVSQAVEELLTDTARDKLRHLDTVTVKGSSVRQRIFTYDMRHQGVDFFLFARSDKDADLDAECYTQNIWTTDQDLLSMRQHVSSEFLTQFNFGRDQYIAGNWPSAIAHLEKADRIMIKHVVDEGFVEESVDAFDDLIFDWDNVGNPDIVRLRNELGDGAARCLLAFMKKRGGVAPPKW
eukprot:CAMPEP_0172422826 /NCGR_PEP_ID=MMETSP1064-20121228/8945_1 /TAXON_ID=202472 /ORGANISM="Aulacoseira subarctica , Strain CCAP 1002/5" /LENGTH=1415 /DNA_ID=CAMNT_0013163879 /DNA_START=50 /DNA_END=4294 /DNA_ORIENTATION=+